MSEIHDDIRADAIGTRGSDRSREIRLEFEIHRLTADRDEYAAVALAGLGGIVGTPERGYVQDGGPGQLRADFRELRRLVADRRAEIERLKAERDAWSDEAVRMLKERNAIIALCVKHYHVENRPIWWNLVGITGCDSPAEAVRVAAGLPRSNGEDMRS